MSRSHTHTEGRVSWQCSGGLTKAECDRIYGEWQDDRFVAVAAKSPLTYHKDRSSDAALYTQVVQVLAGTREDITNGEGNPNMSAAAKRLRKAIERYRSANPQ